MCLGLFHIYKYERTLWKLFHKRAAHSKLVIYVFINGVTVRLSPKNNATLSEQNPIEQSSKEAES
jgi:hypothetical protein